MSSILLLSLAGCAGGSSEEEVSDEVGAEGMSLNRIVYVGDDNGLFIINPDGTDVVKIPLEPGFYTWPTWAPDGESLIFSGAVTGGNGQSPLGLYLYTRKDGTVRKIYTNQPTLNPTIGSTIFHYVLWSPDSKKIAFIARTNELGLTLYVDDIQDDRPATVVTGGVPLYFSWSFASRHMLIHHGAKHFLLDTQGEPELQDLRISSGGYGAPAWSPTEDKLAFVDDEEDGTQALYVSDTKGQNRRYLIDIPVFGAVLWSPDGQSLAVARTPSSRAAYYGGLTLVTVDGTQQRVLTQERLMAFFWSPDGRKIATIALTDQRDTLRLMVLDVEGGTERVLLEFVPSEEQFAMFTFFDQYSYSHTLWSPDSTEMVLSGRTSGGISFAASGRQPVSQVLLVDMEGVNLPRSIAEGVLAFWSPR